MLTKDQILKIPKMRKTMNNVEIAKELKTHPTTIIRWARRLREAGHDVPKLKGGPKIEL